ncbi:MAG: tyrosine-type recombinase/integrase [Polaromonas sp.]
MSTLTLGGLARDIGAFLTFKRALGHSYRRGELTLESFQRFVARQVSSDQGRPRNRAARVVLEEVIRAWLSRPVERKAVTIGLELGILRQWCLYRRRRDPKGFVPDSQWAPQKESEFLPYIFSREEVRRLLSAATQHRGRNISAGLLHTLLLILYCTGLRVGEAVRLRLTDVDLTRHVIEVRQSKGKSRLVPFGADLAQAIERYLCDTRPLAQQAAQIASDALFLRLNGQPLTMDAASDAIRKLLRGQGMKPASGRIGPRPYDFRHAFAVHRLTDWYRQGVDIHARLPWLSAYMGHDNVLGTETYLHATPELLRLASARLEGRLRGPVRSPQ